MDQANSFHGKCQMHLVMMILLFLFILFATSINLYFVLYNLIKTHFHYLNTIFTVKFPSLLYGQFLDSLGSNCRQKSVFWAEDIIFISRHHRVQTFTLEHGMQVCLALGQPSRDGSKRIFQQMPVVNIWPKGRFGEVSFKELTAFLAIFFKQASDLKCVSNRP